jgi:hypothetical protein
VQQAHDAAQALEHRAVMHIAFRAVGIVGCGYSGRGGNSRRLGAAGGSDFVEQILQVVFFGSGWRRSRCRRRGRSRSVPLSGHFLE